MAFTCRRGQHLIPAEQWAHLVPFKLNGWSHLEDPWGVIVCDDHVTEEELHAIARNRERRFQRPGSAEPKVLGLTKRRREVLDVIWRAPHTLMCERGHVHLQAVEDSQPVKVTEIIRALVAEGYCEWIVDDRKPTVKQSRRVRITEHGVEYMRKVRQLSDLA